MNSQKRWITIGTIFMSMILVLTLAACVQSQAGAQEPDRVSYQLNWVYQAQFAGSFVAEQQGFYTAENLRVDIIPGGPTFNPMDKLIAREVDFAVITDPIDVLKAREANQPIVAVAAIYQQNPNVWISLAEKNITTVQDMIGKRIGNKAVGAATFSTLLTAAGVDETELDVILIEDFTIRPLIDDEVDILYGFALNEPLAAKERGYEINVITLADLDVFLPSQILVVHEDLLKANPDLIGRFVRATLKGWETVVNDPEAGLKATLQVDETLDATHQANMVEAAIALVSPETASIGHMDDEMWQQIMQIALNQKSISAPVDLSKVYTTQFLQ